MKKTLLVAALAFCAGSASATVLTFEGIASPGNVTSYYNSGFSSNGFDFLFDHGHILDSTLGGYAFNNGTDWLMHDASGVLKISKTGGGVFSLSQFDHGNYSGSSATGITLTGYFADNSTISALFTNTGSIATSVLSSAWSNLTRIEFVGTSGNYNQAYDNIVMDGTQVPEPGSLALAGLGLAGLIAARRKKA